MGVTEEHTGLYVCLNRRCKRHNTEVGKPWNGDWPLDKRRHKCTGCRKFMILFKVKKVMTVAAKQKLKELNARKRSASE